MIFFNSRASVLSRLQFIYTYNRTYNVYTTRTTSAVLSTTLLYNKYNHCHVELIKLIYDKKSWYIPWKYPVTDTMPRVVDRSDRVNGTIENFALKKEKKKKTDVILIFFLIANDKSKPKQLVQ